MVSDLLYGLGRKVKHEAIPIIERKVKEEGHVYYVDIAFLFGVSATTARRWLIELASKNPDTYFYYGGYLYAKKRK